MAVTDQTAQQPPTQQPPAQSNAGQDTALAAVAATLLPTPTNPAALSVDATAIMTAKLLEALRKFQNQREAGFQDELTAEATRFGPSLQEAAGNLISRELGYESTFRGKQFDRVSNKLTEALLIPDKTERDAKIKQVFEDERRYTQMRETAMRKRVIMGLEHYTLEGVSPDGAFWQLGEAKMHTPDCVVGSTRVSGPDARDASRRPYTGDLIHVVLSSGKQLSVTPNHPILTSRGWVAAQLLVEGDEAFSDSGHEQKFTMPENNDHVPATIEAVFEALDVSVADRHRTALHLLDFHGDGIPDTDVCVVAADGWLSLDGQTMVKPVDDHALLCGYPAVAGFTTACERFDVSGGVFGAETSARASQAGSTPSSVLLGAHRGNGLLDRVAAATTDLNARFEQVRLERRARESKLAGETIDGFTGPVAIDNVVEVRRERGFSGHVYNLSTRGGWYGSNGVVTKNCVSMSGKHWPWMVLHDFQPPVHPRCACRLVSTQSAIAHGLMTEDDVQDPMDAQATAIQAQRLAQEARDAGADWIDLEEAYDLRYAKGTEFAGRFKPRVGGDPGATLLRKMGLLGRGQHRSPLRDSDGHWTRLGGRSVRIPHGEWRQTINGIGYSSPGGSTNVYREGQLVSPPVSTNDPGKIHGVIDAVRQQLRGKVIKRSGPPLRRGDGPEAVNSMEARGYDMTDVAPAGKGVWRASWANRAGIDNVHALITHKGVRSARWDTVPIDRQRAGVAKGPPASFAAHTADMKAWSGELAERYGTHSRIRDISTDVSLEDHAGYKSWHGDIRLGRDVQPDLERAAAARAAGRSLTESELRGVYASMWTSAHEVSHTVNPLAAKDADPAAANLEEALTEENAHRLASERLASQGQADVLDWARRNPTSVVVRGVYRQNRGALADIFDRAGLSDDQRARMVQQLKFNVNPKDRFKVLGGLLRQKETGLSEQQAEDDARNALTDGSSRPRGASPQSPGVPQKFKDAYQEIQKYVSNSDLPIGKPDQFKRAEPAPKIIIGGGKPPKVQGPIPSYAHVPLELGGKDFGSGAQKATDPDGRPWIVQQHDGDKNHVASELLAGAIYKALGVAVAQPGTVATKPVPDFSETPDDLVDEPELPDTGRLSTGVILRDKNGKVTIVEPRNHYGGYVHCVPLRSEALTRTGWKSHEEVCVGDETLGYNPTTGLNEWTEITEVVRFAGAETVWFGGEKWAAECTDEHRWLVEFKDGSRAMRRVSEGLPDKSRVVLAAPAPEGDATDPRDAALLAWIVTDGHIRRTRGAGSAFAARIMQTKPRGCEALDDLLAEFPHRKAMRPDGFVYALSMPWLRAFMDRLGWQGSKNEVPALVAGFGEDALSAFAEAAMLAEGDADRRRMYQNDGPVLDAMLIAEYRLGRAPRAYGSRRCKTVASNRPTVGKKGVRVREAGVSDVWCVKTGLGTWTMRQDGQVMLTGNTFPKGGVEKGLTAQQNAKKELWEETGLHAHITGVVGDFKGDTGVTRFYEGVKTGGIPTVSDETQAVKSVSPKDAVDMLNKDRDKKVLSAVLARPVPDGKFEDDFPEMRPGIAAAYPVPAGKRMDVTKNNAAVARDYMADALLGNWDFVGDRGANMRFAGDDHPTRMNLGSSFEYAPSGRSKPYDGTPSDVWTMLRRGQARGRVNLSDGEMRSQASAIAATLTPDKINALVSVAPFADEQTRDRIAANLTSRVNWMRDYGHGLVDLPKPAEGDAAKTMLSKAFEHFDLYPEEQAALDDYNGAMRDTIDGVARDKKPAGKPEATAMGRLDDAIDATEVPDDLHAWVSLPAGAGAGLAGKTVQQRSYTPLSTDEPKGPRMRVMIPGGSRALYMGDDTKPGESNILLPRGARLQVDGVDADGSTVHATLLPYKKPPKVLPPHTPYKQGQFNAKPWETKPKVSAVQSHDFKAGDRVQFAGGKTPYRVINASPLTVKAEGGITPVVISHANDIEHIDEQS
jgi:ADP-ribose pyrophosphatase YjhB (NUDIX family)